MPYHLTVWSGKRLIAAAPLYVKGHSAGEFVFDHMWADVAQRLNISYYPKLVGMSPFTPMVGYRFLMAPDVDEPDLTRLMVKAIDALCLQMGLSGVSFLFVDPRWGRQMQNFGFQPWQHLSFTWFNRQFQTFDDYLACFNSNQRRNIKRERHAMQDQDITLRVFTDKDIPDDIIPRMYRFYERTNDKFGPWGCKYLTPSFFEMVRSRFARRLVVVAAFRGVDREAPVGMSFLVRKNDQLYGRYWGCENDLPMLHFNACYYAPIEWAIRNGIQQFDPGMGGAHKSRRGFEAIPNHSLHRFSNERLQLVMDQHIGAINRLEGEQIEKVNRQLPFANR
jgi:predicted N-acyltransferase